MAKLDLLAVGPANIELGGGWQHNAEVVTRLPKYGFEVAYTPHLFVLPAVISNEDVAKFYRGVLKSMEERGVFVPSLIHDIVEGGRLGPAPLSERLRRVAALTTRGPHGPLRKALIAAQTLLWDPYFPNEP